MILSVLLHFMLSLGFVVYPQRGENIKVLKKRILTECGNKTYAEYYHTGNVFVIKGCSLPVLKNIRGIKEVKQEKIHKIPEITVEKSTFQMDTLPWYTRVIHMYERERLGLSGKGVICGIIDTGIDTTDPHLAESFSGYFYDAVSDSSEPYDDNGHGTAVASLISGEYGIAPSAKVAVCKAFRANGTSTDEDILKCADWFYNLKKQGINIQVINNSWGEAEAEYMFNAILSWDSLSILSAFSAGNNGPYGGLIDAPSVYPVTFSIGATTQADTLAWFSSRGPAPDTGIFSNTDYWPTEDWNYTKPDFVAPGEYIYITLPGGNHGIASGTSLSTPIFSGMLCLLKEAKPDIGFKEAYRIIKNHAAAREWWIHYPDTGYGFGRIDIGMLADYLEPKIVYDTITLLSFPDGIPGTYSIFTVDGRLIKKGNTPLCNLNAIVKRPGIYLLNLRASGKTYKLKFFVIK